MNDNQGRQDTINILEISLYNNDNSEDAIDPGGSGRARVIVHGKIM